MTAERSYEDYLHDILDHAEKAERFLTGVPSAEALQKDERALFAVVRALEVIGEAAKRIPQDSIVKCEQIQTIAQSRLGRQVGKLDADRMREVDRALTNSPGIEQAGWLAH